MKQRIRFGSVALISMILPAIAMAKPDVVIFINGDRLTGEVKSLERGKLKFDSSATGTIPVEWDEVAFLSSNQDIQVEVADGTRYLGKLIAATDKGRVIVDTAGGAVDLDAEIVVHMTPIELESIERLDGSITAGYSFTKASEIQQIRLGLDMAYRTETRIYSLDIDTAQTDSQESDASMRHSLDLQYTRLHRDRWLSGAVLRLDSNDELNLDLRTSIGFGGGRILRQSNATTLQLVGGIQISREDLDQGTSNEDTLEAFGSLTWDWFRYDSPELDLSTNVEIYPNLTDTGRVRAELDIAFRWELVTDLFWQLSLYNSFDSRPAVTGAERNDYGVTTSLGLSF